MNKPRNHKMQNTEVNGVLDATLAEQLPVQTAQPYSHIPPQWQNKISRSQTLELPVTSTEKPKKPASYKLAWADGLRGVASAVVVSQHFVSAFAPDMNDGFGPGEASPSFGLHHGLEFFALPVIRILYAGNLAVAIFFILSGFVLPLGFFRKGNAQRLGSSIFRRVPRLLIPLVFFSFFSYILLITGGYNAEAIAQTTKLATGSETMWFSAMSPTSKDPAVVFPFLHWFTETFVMTWYNGNNDYLAFAWTLRFELIGSILVYCAALGFQGNKYTMFYMLLPLIWCFNQITYHDTIYIASFFIGFMISWLHTPPDDICWTPYKYFLCTREQCVEEEPVSTQTPFGKWCLISTCTKPKIVTYHFVQLFWLGMLLFGCYLGSYPLRGIRAPPYLWMTEIAQAIYPGFKEPEEWGYFWNTIAGGIIFLSIWISDPCQWVLSTRIPVFLGDISFMLYLWHGPAMLTFTNVTFLGLYPSLGYSGAVWASYFITWVFLLITSWIFTKTVDWLSIKAGQWLEEKSYDRAEKQL